MVKFDFRSTSSAWRRNSFTQIAWKVPSHGIPSTASPNSAPTRPFISRAALLVKVTARISLGRACRCQQMRDPGGQRAGLAGARARQHQTGPSSRSTASRCAGFSPSR
jgi:hypothetical protein